MDVTPVVNLGRHPAKASVGEFFDVTALVFREGHDQLGAEVVLTDPDGVRRPPKRMRDVEGQVSRMAATVCPDTEGAWTFEVQAWSDPIGTWLHDAGIKIRAGVDVELMFAEGVLLLERVAGLPKDDRPRQASTRRPSSRTRSRRSGTPAARSRPDWPRPSPRRWRRSSPPTRCATCSAPRARTRSSSTASGRCSPAGTSSSRAPRAPTSTRHRQGRQRDAPHRGRAAAGRGRHGLRRDLPAADPPDRRGEPQGRQQHAHPDARRRRLALGDRQQGRRARRHPPRPRHVRGLRRVRGAGHERRPGGGARLRAPGRSRPPVGRPSTRSGSPPAPTAPSPTPRTRRRSTRTSTRSTSTTTPRASTPSASGWSGTGCHTACGSSGSTTRTPSRSCSGSGCSAGSARPTRTCCSSPRRSPSRR